jgi:hypothetical protein
MMNKTTAPETALLALCLFLGITANAKADPAHVYPSGMTVALQIENDLYESLDAKYQDKLHIGTDLPGAAAISEGFVELINHIAHAKAIDKVAPGFFDLYMAGLVADTTNGDAPRAPAIVADKYWSDDIMNDQASYFNQMMGMTMAINLSHHYLGSFDKHAGQVEAGKATLINNYLTTSEWDKEVRAAAVNSLNCALSTAGAKALFEAIDRMPRRPSWTAYFVPQHADIKRLTNQLGRYEVAFYRGGLN